MVTYIYKYQTELYSMMAVSALGRTMKSRGCNKVKGGCS